MKIFLKFFRIIILTLCFCAINTEINASNVVQNNAEKAALIERYLIQHKENIIDYSTKYKFINDTDIQKGLSKIDSLIVSLKRIQSNNLGHEDTVISIILEDIKVINDEMKLLLNLKKTKYDKTLQAQKEAYQKLGKQLGEKLDEIYLMFYPPLLNKSNLTEKEQRLKNSLEILNILGKDIRNFGGKNFDTIEQLQVSFLGVLNSIKYYVLILKENLKK